RVLFRSEGCEHEVGACGEVTHRAGDHNLTRSGLAHHTRRDVHADPAHVGTKELDLAGVDARPYPDLRLGEPVGDLDGALDCPSRSVEGREDAVTGALDEPPAEAVALRVRDAIVAIEQLTPAAIAQ